MKIIELKKLEIENFKGLKKKTVDFSHGTFIKGMNGIGKSTLYNATLWLLFDKDMNGNSATDIRPRDADGNDIHFIDISVRATFDLDGIEITLEKRQSEKWMTKRGETEKTFKGNENNFSVNDIPKSQKDYSAFISENFCPEDIFLSCSNASAFFKLDTKKRRAKLMSLAKAFTDAEVIESNSQFSELAEMLTYGTVEELIARSKNSIKKLNEDLKMIPTRIDEQEKSRMNLNFSDLELYKNDLIEKISKIDEQMFDINKSYEEYQKSTDGILDLKFQLNEIRRKANMDYQKKKDALSDKLFQLKKNLYEAERGKSNLSIIISSDEQVISKYEQDIIGISDMWKTEKEREFYDSSLVCRYCGQEYPSDKKNALKEEFESNKASMLDSIVERGMTIKTKCDELKSSVEQKMQIIEDYISEIEIIKNQILEVETESASILEVDLSKNEEYQSLQKQIDEKDALIAKGFSCEDVRYALSEEKKVYEMELHNVNGKLAFAQRNNDIDERIAELKEEQRDISQKSANEQRILDLLEDFNRAKMNMLTEEVNKHFKRVKWVLFSEQINGGFADCCKATVNGIDYEKGLNDSDCLLANIDILETFQSMNDVQLPIFIDRAESINSFRLPASATQLITLSVSDDTEMVVQNG